MLSMGSGGAEKVVSLLMKKLVRDYNVSLVLFYDVIHFPIPKEVNIITLSKNQPTKPFISKLLDFFGFSIKYYRFVKSYHVQTSISFLPFPNFINGIVAIGQKKVKTIISERGFPSSDTTGKLSLIISKLFYPFLYNRCDKLFSNSTHINNDLKENFGIKIPMEVIYNPIEIPSNIINPNRLIDNGNTLKIITAGSLNSNKNHLMILRALDRMHNINEYSLSILGGGELFEFLSHEIIKHKLEPHVKLYGKVKDVSQHFFSHDCFVLSSYSEGFPNALLEAMSVGLPCISTNCLSGPLELLNENLPIDIKIGEFYVAKYGLLINNNDDLGLQKALQYFKHNPLEREKFCSLSVERSKLYQLENIYGIFKKFIQL